MLKLFASGTILTLIFLTSFSFQPTATGKEIYKRKCINCHGADGTKRKFGAKNLQASKLDDAAIFQLIQNGKGVMAAFKSKLTAEQISQVRVYVKSLRK